MLSATKTFSPSAIANSQQSNVPNSITSGPSTDDRYDGFLALGGRKMHIVWLLEDSDEDGHMTDGGWKVAHNRRRRNKHLTNDGMGGWK